ncbi:heterokaryon incompatibility, partial [Lentithecium fluviatile CBS 122367]
VDALCIVQDDGDEKHHQISRMDQIYSSAYITLVAAEGECAGSGLSRVSLGSKSEPRTFTADGMTYEIGEYNKDILKRSKWMTRGWTFQELVLSLRSLFFTRTQVFFYC